MSQPTASSESFVPFEPAAAAPRSPAPPNLKVVSHPEPTPGFTPLEARHSTHPPSRRGPDKPLVTLHREGDRVTSIRIECSCGQVLELSCSYDTNPLAP